MIRFFFPQSLICLLVVSCSVQDFDIQNASSKHVFHAYFESYSEPDTKVYVNEKVKLLWDEKDQISLFNKTYLNQLYQLTAVTEGNACEFEEVPTGSFATGGNYEFICAVYPYQSTAKIGNNDVLTLFFPAEQKYRESSFGPGANTMVSVTKEDPLVFKNAGGYLVLKFYGKDVSVSSITLEGRNGEFLSGNATWKPAVGAIPEFTFVESKAESSITLICDNPVSLGTSKETATVFWMVVPPTPFEKGFKLTVTSADGKTFIKETDKNLSILRNTLFRIAPIEVKFN